MNSTILFFLGVILSASGIVSPPLALLGGLAFGLLLAHPFATASRSLSRFLLQASVVLLGFGMNLDQVLRAGKDGFLFTAVSISFALVLGWALGRLLQVRPKASFLITCGTAICGGSAIAAIAPVTNAGEEDMAVSLGTVFTLNAVALLLFPAVGWKLHLTQSQFGLWAALAIHDTSSVVGAASRFGPQALAVGTTVKLARALWIVPVTLVTAAFVARQATDHTSATTEPAADHLPTGNKPSPRIQLPWFIALFLLAAAVRTWLPALHTQYAGLVQLGKDGLAVVLFLIGTGLSRSTLRRVGFRPMLQGVILWTVVATASLYAIHSGWISI